MTYVVIIIIAALLAGWLKKRGVKRSKDNAVAGVCAGIAKHFGWDVKVTRIITFVAICLTGVPLATYIIAWIVLDEEE